MEVQNLITVQNITAHRQQALDLLAMLKAGHAECRVVSGGNYVDVFTVVPKDMVAQAIMDGCDAAVVDYNGKLAALGVGTPKHEFLRPAESDTRDLNMYVRAWIRELGGKIFPKAHLIDGLVLTTQRLRDLFERRGKQLTALRLAISKLDQTQVQGTPAYAALVTECERTDELMKKEPGAW